MAISYLTHVSASPGANGGASSGIDTTGANFFVICIGYYSGGGSSSVAVSDSKSNAGWTHLNDYSQSFDSTRFTMYYCTPTTVGSAHTFTVSNTGIYPGFCVLAFSGMAATSVFQSGTDHGNNALSTTIQPGACAGSGSTLVITGVSFGVAGTMSIGSGFAISDQVNYSAGVDVGCAGAYLIQSPGSSVNPTWTENPTSNLAAGIAAFAGAVGIVAGKTSRPSIAVQRSAYY